jgi:predicted nucleic acid-binding protein
VSFLLATDVVSELRRRSPDPAVLAWFQGVPASELYLSVLTIGEIRLGIEQLRGRDPSTAEQLDEWLAALTTAYRDRIVTVDEAVAQRWGRLDVPDRLPVIDGLLAATVLVRDWTLVTRNVRDIARSGARVLDPFTAAN